MMQGEGGFTLIETLVALAILSVVLVILYGAGATSLVSSTHISNIDRAVLLAQSKLDDLATMSTPLPVRTSGTFPGTDIRWIETAKAIPDNISVTAMVLQDVHLELLWNNGLHHQSLDVETRHLGSARP